MRDSDASQCVPRFASWRRRCVALIVLLGGGLAQAAPTQHPEFCASGARPTPEQLAWTEAMLQQAPASTREMAALLQKINRAGDPMKNQFRSAERVAHLRDRLATSADPDEVIRLKTQLTQQLLNAGDPVAALQENEDVERRLRARGVALEGQLLVDLLYARAMCYLRMGEQENCLLNRNGDACLFPIQGGGVHQRPRGSRGAVAALTQLLERFPGDLRARWLLNVACMTLGDYPAKVPAPWLIEPERFASEYALPRFPDVARDVGIDVEGLAGGVVLEDFDNDGWLDLMVSGWGLTSQLRYYHNDGNGAFTERTAEARLVGLVGGLNLIQADYDNDGFKDVVVLRGAWLGSEGNYPCSLLRNNGDGTFTDTTVEAGLLRLHPSNSAVWFDFNQDGWLDLYIVNESKESERHPNELFRNNGNGTFTECAAENGVAFVAFFKGVVSGDFNNDGRPDLFLSRLDGPKILLRNDGPAGVDRSPKAPWRFTDVAAAAGVTDPPTSFTCWFWDYDNDGWQDIIVFGYAVQDVGDIAADYLGLPYSGQRPKLYRNRGDGTFADVTKEAGLDKMLLTMGGNFGDLDNDGWLDFYVGTGNPDLGMIRPNRMFRNDGGTHFQDVTVAGGFGQLQKGHGVAFGDLNNDGAQDVYAVIGGAFDADHFHGQLFANPGTPNHWLNLQLEGVSTNRSALGARIKVVVDDEGRERALNRTVGSGGSFGASPLAQHFGLGAARVLKRVEIFWPVSGATQVITGLAIDQSYALREGDAAPTRHMRRPVPWPAASVAESSPALRAAPGPVRPSASLGKWAPFFASIRLRLGLQQGESGAAYRVEVGRGGPRPRLNDRVVFSCVATAADGRTAVAALSAQGMKIGMDEVLPGFQEILQMMTVGSVAVFVLPPELTFGDGDWPPGVERGTPLIFQLTLHEVVTTAPAAS